MCESRVERVGAPAAGAGRWRLAYRSMGTPDACVLAMDGCGVRGESWRVLAGAQRAAMTAACVRHGLALRHSECEGDWVMMAG
eukprot:COSAG03_NODE_247_length_10027_cov_32.921434_2_plen_83_part_00